VNEAGSPGSRRLMVIRGILQYLVMRPEAKDTVEGVCRWWLPHDCGDLGSWGEDEVQPALDDLVERGWVTTREMTPSHTIYGLNSDRLETIKAFLGGGAGHAEGDDV